MDYAFCVAPMLDWTDRHCRFFHRLLTRRARLYSEMITTGALLHGDAQRLLAMEPTSPGDGPVALQLGGSEPADLATCARLAQSAGYDEVNLNCGCPSERVQRGAFGACLMAEPRLVADCVAAMRDATSLDVTVKHRIGLGRDEDYGFVRDFVGQVAQAGCGVFIVHARNAWLQGLSPKENREVPPLRYDVVERLAADFPALRFVLNGGLQDHESALRAGAALDGVMVGRQAYRDPWMLSQVDSLYHGVPPPVLDRRAVVDALAVYAADEVASGTPLRAITRHVLGLLNGLPGARRWRRMMSDATLLRAEDPALIPRAYEAAMSSHAPLREAADAMPAADAVPAVDAVA